MIHPKTERFYYRKLTDKDVGDDVAQVLSKMPELDDIDYVLELGMGNKALFETVEVNKEWFVHDTSF